MDQQYLSTKTENFEKCKIDKLEISYPQEPENCDEWCQWAIKHPSQEKKLKTIEPWQRYAGDLAKWTLERLVVRTDAYGSYSVGNGKIKRYIKKNELTSKILENHFSHSSLESLIGLLSTSTDDKCKSLTIDIDRHDGEPENLAENNHQFALNCYQNLERLGFTPLLIDSNGTGGYHLRIFFDQLTPAKVLRVFGLWLVQDFEKYKLETHPEIFPKQNTINEKYGNFCRLIGRHHQREHYSAVWDGQEWKHGEDAIKLILSREGDSTDLIPSEAMNYQSEKIEEMRLRKDPRSLAGTVNEEGDQWIKRYSGDIRTLDVLSLLQTKSISATKLSERKYEIECPWSDEHTTGDETANILIADEDNEAFPVFHCFHEHCKNRSIKDVLSLFPADEVNRHCEKEFENLKNDNVISGDDPLETARLFLMRNFSVGGEKSLVHYQGEWQLWDGCRYARTTDDDLKAVAWLWLASCLYQSKPKKNDPGRLFPFKPTRGAVISVLDALKAATNIPSHLECPAWIAPHHSKPESIIAFKNGLLDLDSYLSDHETELIEHTPKWLSMNCLPHIFDRDAKCPMWLEYLNVIFENDTERIRALAQWFGYNLTIDSRQQKLAMLIGPPRSGKGTTMKILTHMLGKENVANPTLTSLGGRFGLATLVGKQAAIIADAHLGRNSDSIAILEKLKSIVGCDEQNVDRKNKSELANVRINARFTIAANELPRLPDTSVSLREKMILIPYNLSFAGKEDYDLPDRLLGEISGITNWAINGLLDLRKSGRLLQPTAGQEIVMDFVRLSSPLSAYIEDCCEVGVGKSEATETICKSWKQWCLKNGHEAGSSTAFGIKLRAAVVGLVKSKARSGDKTFNVYHGIKLNDAASESVRNADLLN